MLGGLVNLPGVLANLPGVGGGSTAETNQEHGRIDQKSEGARQNRPQEPRSSAEKWQEHGRIGPKSEGARQKKTRSTAE